MDRERAIRLLVAGEKMLDIADGASSAWQAMKTGKTFSDLAVQTSIGAEKVQKGSALATFTILTGIMGSILVNGYLKRSK